MADEDFVMTLIGLNDQVSAIHHFNKLLLFMRCLDFGDHELSQVGDISKMHRLILNHEDYKDVAKGILQCMLQNVGVPNADTINASDDDLTKAEKLLPYPTLLVYLCNQLGNTEYRQFKLGICSILGCHEDAILSREDLMRRLITQDKISSTDVTVLSRWLTVAKCYRLARVVDEYIPVSREANNETRSQQASERGVPTREQLVQETGIKDSDLSQRVTKASLYLLKNAFSDDWETSLSALQVFSPEDGSSFHVMDKWHANLGERATVGRLVDEFLMKGKAAYAKKACSVLKVPEPLEIGQRIEKIVQFCKPKMPPMALLPHVPGPHRPLGTASAVLDRDKLWDVTQFRELKVHFLNPEVLADPSYPWKCGDDPLTKNLVLEWARNWNSHAVHYPKISDVLATKEEAQIRVMFVAYSDYNCWSCVGSLATNEATQDPTMVLNLYNLHKPTQRSLVLHEFGHALGLEHEHQRSDFWDVLEQRKQDGSNEFKFIISKDDIRAGGAGDEHFRAPPQEGCRSTDYDPKSIMHYWFDKNWLQPNYRDELFVKTTHELKENEREVLLGVHMRDHRNRTRRLANSFSKKDYKHLNNEYESLYNSQMAQNKLD